MRHTYLGGMLVVMAGLAVGGCGKSLAPTGFLSDYSKLDTDTDVEGVRYGVRAMRYIGPDVGRYSQFIVDPVQIHLHSAADGTDRQMLREVAGKFHAAIVRELSGGYKVVSRPGPGVARIRVAITDIDKDTVALNVLPQTKLMGAGLGGAAMEGEIVDSQSGKQIAAVIQGQKGKAISLDGLSKWSSAKAVVEYWAATFKKRLDKAHGR